MLCIVTVLHLHVLHYESFHVFCVVRVARLHVLYCESAISTCFVLWEWYVYVFCIVALLSEKKFKRSVLGNVIQFAKLYILCLICLFCDSSQTYPVNIVTRLGIGLFRYSNRSRGKRLCFS